MKIETITNVLKGVSESTYNNEEKNLVVKYNPEEINPEMILSILDIVGFNGEIVETKSVDKTIDTSKDSKQ